jgi:hypothetical protein
MTTSRRSATNSLQPRRSGELDARENLLIVVVDEHNAHLDGTNTGQIAQLMRRLSGRVQFILGAPTDEKGTTVAGSCDIQVTFLPRDPGSTLSPPRPPDVQARRA